MRILHTGDLHIGRKYTKQRPEASDACINARIDVIRNINQIAHDKECDYVVIAGDLFDSKNIPVSVIKSTCQMLSECPCPVIVIAGNHDYCDANDRLWPVFQEHASDNTIFLAGELETEEAVFHACPCHDRYSSDNALHMSHITDHGKLQIGIAHGAVEGLSYDGESKYYFMTIKLLENTGMDLWLIGHPHIPAVPTKNIFNAGTPQQTDISDNSPGSVYVIDINKDHIHYEQVKTNIIRFEKLEATITPGKLESTLRSIIKPDHNRYIRLILNGTASTEEYNDRLLLYERIRSDLLELEVIDHNLGQEITEEMIDEKTVSGSIENQMLKEYLNEPKLLALAYSLIESA